MGHQLFGVAVVPPSVTGTMFVIETVTVVDLPHQPQSLRSFHNASHDFERALNRRGKGPTGIGDDERWRDVDGVACRGLEGWRDGRIGLWRRSNPHATADDLRGGSTMVLDFDGEPDLMLTPAVRVPPNIERAFQGWIDLVTPQSRLMREDHVRTFSFAGRCEGGPISQPLQQPYNEQPESKGCNRD